MDKNNEWKKEYIKDDFVVNTTLSKCTQMKDLSQVTKDLKTYAHELHESMTEILKEETEAIVNLAQGLSELSVQIMKLTTPLTQFHEEILILYEIVTDAEKVCQSHLDKSKELVKEQHFESLMSSISSIAMYVEKIVEKQLEDVKMDIALYERAIDEYSINVNHLKESKKTSLESIVDLSLEQKLKLLTDNKFIKALKNNDDRVTHCCLRAYVSLNRQEDAELIYTKSIVEPALSKIFSSRNLERHKNDLNMIYREALQFLHSDMAFLLNIINRNPDLKGYNFVINAFWNSADRLLRANLPQTTASGNPELFQRRFNDTWNFLQSISSKVDPKLRSDLSFQEHMKRFNLAVYFEIRHQQICASFEKDLIENSNIQDLGKVDDKEEFKLVASAALWRSLNHCFHPEVFLNHLCDQFFRLSMMLISRYLRYLSDIAEKASQESEGEIFLINCLLDITVFKKRLGVSIKDNIRQSVYNVMVEEVYPLLEKAAGCNEDELCKSYENIVKHLISKKVEKGKVLLQQVGAIPRLYRRTNKSIPTEPSLYVIDIVNPIMKFHKTYSKTLQSDVLNITNTAINKIGEQYLSVIQEVLHSVCKTEESLRRLKNRNVVSNDESSQNPDLTTDESKIREQIRLDVAYFVHHLSEFVIDQENTVLRTLKLESGCGA